MNVPSPPDGYDVSKRIPLHRQDCILTVGFDRDRERIPRFLVQLHYRTARDPLAWEEIARMDHNETSKGGHDVYQEGLHVDVRGGTDEWRHLRFSGVPLPNSRGALIRECTGYFERRAQQFVDIYEGRRWPGGPPRWSDGGDSTPRFIRPNPVEHSMSRESSVEDADEISVEELTELLAEAEDTTPEEIERGAEEFEIPPLTEATVVDE
jgi:hypothetical protein